MDRIALSLGIILGLLSCLAPELRAEDAPAEGTPPAVVCNCKPMSVTVRDAGGRAVSAVSVSNFSFVLESITINIGDSITWTNMDAAPHTATSDTSGVFDTGTLTTGQSSTILFNKAGTIPYHCSIHPFMTGSITVLANTKPTIKNLVANAIVNVPFSYTITASGTPPFTFAAAPLPDGFQLNGAIITGMFTTAGAVSIPLTATNPFGTDTKNLVVTVAASGGSGGDISGNWVGKLKGKHFEEEGPSPKAENSTITLVILQTGSALSVTATINGAAPSFVTTGQVGNKNLWLLGGADNADQDSIAISAHLDKKGLTLTGTGIRYNAHGDEEFTFTAKKH